MAISKRNLSKWFHMIKGDSILHVNQGVGKAYSVSDITGYYNDLTEKITLDKENEQMEVPLTVSELNGQKYHFPIAIFQYGLGAYDLYLLEGKKDNLERFKRCAEWAKNNQLYDGSWEMYELNPGLKKCSAMAQGEAGSLLLRAYYEFNNTTYLDAARKAIDFMLVSVDSGGPTVYQGETVVLLEYADFPPILNGMIFALWGLFDLLKIKGIENVDYYQQVYDKSVQTIVDLLPKFDAKYWSMYDTKNHIASPFYHRLHIAQLKVMYEITKRREFDEYAQLFESYLNNKLYYNKAFMKKAIQKTFGN